MVPSKVEKKVQFRRSQFTTLSTLVYNILKNTPAQTPALHFFFLLHPTLNLF